MSGSQRGDETGEPPTLTIPRGTLLRSRVVSDVGTTLSRALDRGLTGYATLVPQETLLLSGEARGVLTFEDGVPVLAYNTVTDSGGPDALAELAVPGPYRVELYAVDADGLAAAHREDALRVAPDAAATELADDAASRVRSARRPRRTGCGTTPTRTAPSPPSSRTTSGSRRSAGRPGPRPATAPPSGGSTTRSTARANRPAARGRPPSARRTMRTATTATVSPRAPPRRSTGARAGETATDRIRRTFETSGSPVIFLPHTM